MIIYTSEGATNRPQALDEAARRRLTKGFYIPLPSAGTTLIYLFFFFKINSLYMLLNTYTRLFNKYVIGV